MIKVSSAEQANVWNLHVAPTGLVPEEITAAVSGIIASITANGNGHGQDWPARTETTDAFNPGGRPVQLAVSQPVIGLVICPEPFPDHPSWLAFVCGLMDEVTARYARGELDGWMVAVDAGTTNELKQRQVRALGGIRRTFSSAFELPRDLDERGGASTLCNLRGYLN